LRWPSSLAISFGEILICHGTTGITVVIELFDELLYIGLVQHSVKSCGHLLRHPVEVQLHPGLSVVVYNGLPIFEPTATARYVFVQQWVNAQHVPRFMRQAKLGRAADKIQKLDVDQVYACIHEAARGIIMVHSVVPSARKEPEDLGIRVSCQHTPVITAPSADVFLGRDKGDRAEFS
jgi:hypothetical protein